MMNVKDERRRRIRMEERERGRTFNLEGRTIEPQINSDQSPILFSPFYILYRKMLYHSISYEPNNIVREREEQAMYHRRG